PYFLFPDPYSSMRQRKLGAIQERPKHICQRAAEVLRSPLIDVGDKLLALVGRRLPAERRQKQGFDLGGRFQKGRVDNRRQSFALLQVGGVRDDLAVHQRQSL